ncbi:RNA polymerase sigma factor [Pseudoclavibacter endophyticus]|uniref:Sigma-70 family RNA polymerase sigma factor n=1 Tax=Pseudoclavibacter endophyticus TaxID=1778590 RepID=A0A6H9WS02_9MICO|nr:sigma-70 family RNA polymerase sigma factor [Pseudoclavibacter endophyticus]KAB1649707.1 sigma-70 family RNA polymerase sigma factor [Pseudoclavibacter endophyticus]GGA60398.1 RNA polymerase sigma factor [Pseudoclavibacter endophyticus]
MTLRIDDFNGRTRPYRSELLAHCYRMLASIHDAEDAVQETFLRAWRGYDSFEDRSSIRTWLYRIATNACLRALENRGRRALPTGLGGPCGDPAADLPEWPELPWLEPIPDALLGDPSGDSTDPLTTVARRHSVKLAYIAALQHLAPRQRAVLVLRDVLSFTAAEVAAMLDTTPTAVNSLLQRARSQIGAAQPDEADIQELSPGRERDLLDRFVAAMHAHDIPGLVAVLTEDAAYEMPPFPSWFRGAEMIGRMVSAQSPAEGPGDHLLVPTAANGQPAFGLYMPDEYGVFRAFNLQVLTVTPTGVSHVVAFFDLRLFARFGLPETATPT